MKMKKCPQCKNLVSVTAPTCLYCGRPNRFVTDNYVKRKWEKEYNKNKKTIIIFTFSINNTFYIFIQIIFLTQNSIYYFSCI